MSGGGRAFSRRRSSMAGGGGGGGGGGGVGASEVGGGAAGWLPGLWGVSLASAIVVPLSEECSGSAQETGPRPESRGPPPLASGARGSSGRPAAYASRAEDGQARGRQATGADTVGRCSPVTLKEYRRRLQVCQMRVHVLRPLRRRKRVKDWTTPAPNARGGVTRCELRALAEGSGWEVGSGGSQVTVGPG
jgi:hypothetical protein